MKKLLLSFLTVLCALPMMAQHVDPCGFDAVHQRLRTADKRYDSAVRQHDDRWIKYSALVSSALLTYTSAGYVYEIPTVVHVIHTGDTVGSSYNPDSTKIAQMIDYMNNAYAAQSPFPDTAHGGCRIPLKFVLAKRSPTGASTNGIVRVNGSSLSGYTAYGANAATTTGVDPQNIMALSRWPPADYYNVYSVNKIDGNDLYSTGGIAGFAYFPGTPYIDGMIVAASQIKSGSTTVSHEFGHAFSLYHTFEGDAGGTTCPSTTSCSTTGDLVCDTEPHIRESSAFPSTWCPPTDVNSCTGLSYNNTQYNIMDYTTCPPNRFTAGQRTRVLNTLDNERVGYKTSLGLTAPSGTIATAACIPSVGTLAVNIGPVVVEFNGMKVWTGDSYLENAGYVDHAYNQQTTVKKGSSYTLNVTTAVNVQNVRAFIDMNNDGDFSDAGEQVFSHNGTTTSEVHSGSITIPSSITTCTYLRMRVVSVYSGATPSDYACGPYTYGQAEDYGIYVVSDTPTATTPIAYCAGATATALTATGSNLKWYTAATGGTGSSTAPTPSTASAGSTTYYVTQSGDASATCESDRKAIVVNITTAPAAPAVTSPVAYCAGASASALSATGTSLLWYTSASGGVGSSTAPTPSTATAGSTTYYVSQTTGGCESPRAAIVVNVNAIPSAPTVTSPVALCLSSTASALTATGTGLLWYSAATGGSGSTTAPTPSTAAIGSTNYYVSQTVSGCESPRATITVNVVSSVAAPTVSSPVNYCVGASSSALTATGTGLLWYSAATGGTGSATAPTPSTASAGTTTYYVSQTVSGCESPRASITVNVNSIPSAPTVSSPVTYCAGATPSALTASGTGLLWYTAATGGSGATTAPTPSTVSAGTTNYYVSQTVSGCESPRANIAVTVNSLPAAPSVTSPVTYCAGATATALSATGSGLLWYSVATGGTGSATAPTPSTASAGTTNYYVSQTVSGCEGSRATIAVTVNSVPSMPSVSSPVTYCLGFSASALTATGTGLLWYTAATGGSGSATAPTPSTATAGSTNYYVSQTVSGCESPRATLTATVYSAMTAPSATATINYCIGATASALTASGTNLRWYTVATGGTASTTAPTPSTAATGTTTYYVSQSADASGSCESGRTAIAVTVNPLPTAPTVTSPVNFCNAATASALSATKTSATDTLKWYTAASGGTASTTAPTPSTASTGVTYYYVSQVNVYGCEGARTQIQTNINPRPDSVIISPLSSTTFCNGDSVTLKVSAKVNMAAGTTAFYTAYGQSDGTKSCNCPSGYAIAGYNGRTGDILDGFKFICVPINRYGVIGSGFDSTALNGGLGGGPNGPYSFSSGTFLVGLNAAQTGFSGGYYLSGIQAQGQTLSYISSAGDPTSSPTTLTSIYGAFSPWTSGTIWVPAGHVATGMLSGTLGYSSSVALNYTPVGAFSYTYSWSTSDTADQIKVKTGGTYTVTATNSLGCSRTSSGTVVTVNPIPAAPTVTTPITYCQGSSSAVLTASKGATDTLLWYGAATGGTASYFTPTPSTASAGTTNYWVSVKSAAGCEGSRSSISVVVNAKPGNPTVSSPVTYCQDDAATALTATKSGSTDTLLWYTAATGGTGSVTAPTPVTSAAGSTTYYVSEKSTANCESNRASLNVVVNAKPSSPTVSAVTYCQGATAVALTATRAATTDTLYWYTAATGGTGTTTAPTPSTASAGTTTYYVSERNTNRCESPRVALTVTVNATPAAPTVTTPVNLCIGGATAALTATGTSLKWYSFAAGGTGSTTAPTPSTTVAGTTIYYVSQTNASGCEGSRAAITVTINSLPVAPTVVSPVTYCQGTTAVALTATKPSATDTLYWYTTATGGTGSSTAPVPATATTGTTVYYVSAKSQYGCEGTLRAALSVNVNPTPSAPSVTTPVIYCQNATATTLSASKVSVSDTLKWYTVATGGTGSVTTPVPSTATAGTTSYYVSLKNTFGCEGPRSTITVTVNPLPATPTVTSPVNLCLGGSSSALTATGTGLLWYTSLTGTGSSTAPTPATSPTGTTVYYVTQTDPSTGCESQKASISVVVNPLPAAPTVTSPLNLCQGSVAGALTATGTNLKWYTSATGGTGSTTAPVPSTTVLGTTNYYVSQTSSVGCEGSRAVIAVVVQPLPTVTITPKDLPGFFYCAGKTVTLKATASATVTYQWYRESTALTGATYDTLAAGTKNNFKVVVTSIYGCKGEATVFVQPDTTTLPTMSPTEAYICEEGSTLLYCHPGYTGFVFDWIQDGVSMTPATPKSNTRIVNQAGTYKVTVTNLYGCVNTTNTATVYLYPKPVKPLIVASGTTLSLTPTSGYIHYQWYRNGSPIFSAIADHYTYTSDGKYHAQVTDANGCLAYSDTLNVTNTSVQQIAGTDKSIRVYPNPTSGMLQIESPVKVNAELSDMMGRRMIYQENASSINLVNLPDATYILRIFDENRQLISIDKINKITQ
ncbi:GEVED domain-containing protein [Rurimicrobium arvi]|uniref:Ig-like domain-containing protein n=1 Tax=Rurimicrobium arvi TaxID=2049916 RepID=A0ABP8N0N7_9BACT